MRPVSIEQRKSNCVVFALTAWWRFGGYIVVRRARAKAWWLFHVLWMDPRRRHVVSFNGSSYMPWFHGKMRWGD